MIARAAQWLGNLLGKEPEREESARKRAPLNTTSSLRALTDLGESIAASVHVIESPSRMFLCVAMEPKPEALAAQVERDRRMAAGLFQVDRTWSAAEVNRRWAKDAVLVDGQGCVLEDAVLSARGLTDAGAKEVFFEFGALDAYPEQVYLANGSARIRVR